MEQHINLELNGPGMSPLHRAGMAGLFMTLNYLDKTGEKIDGLSWSYGGTSIELLFSGDVLKSLGMLLKRSFSTDNQGLIHILAHEIHPMAALRIHSVL